MDKKTLKLVIYVLIVVISLFLLYNIWNFDISENIDINASEQFTVSNTELNKMQSSYKYNLLAEPVTMNTVEYTKEISLLNNDDKFIKQIYIISEHDDDTKTLLENKDTEETGSYNTTKKREIPLDLEITVIDSKGNERSVNMQKYKFKSPAPNQLSYADTSVNFMDLLDMNGELLYGNKIKLKSDTYKFMFDKIYIFGNNTGKDYKMPGGERDITAKINGKDTGNLQANKPYVITRLVFSPDNNTEGFKGGRTTVERALKAAKLKEKAMAKAAKAKAKVAKAKEMAMAKTAGAKVKAAIAKANKISQGKTITEIKSNFINIESNIEGFANIYSSNNAVNLTPEILTHYYDNPVLVMDELTSINIEIPNGYLISEIYGKAATTTDIQQFKFGNNMTDFRDSLNPDTIVGDSSLAGKNTLSMDILDVLNYQLKINTELKELDLNKFNVRELYNQKLDIASTIAKIDRVSNKYLNLIKDGDKHNAKKFIETIQILQNIKGELEEQEKLQKVDFNLNIKL